jgi:hypothetical protein
VALLTLVVALLAASCGGSSVATEGESAAPGPSADGTTTSAGPGVPTAPLTGVAVEDPASIAHPALVVKIDNDPKARPQTGLNQADLVYEVRVEGITRFAAVFHSQGSDPVGPIRSARSSDIDLMTNLNQPLFAWSGANDTVTGEVLGAQYWGMLQDVSHSAAEAAYWRDGARYAPHNLYSSTTELWKLATEPVTPPPVLTHRTSADDIPASAIAASGIAVDYQSDRIPVVEFAWDPEVAGWRRFQTDTHHELPDSAHVDSNGVQIAPKNVVALGVTYTDSAAGAYPQAVTVGSGEATILTDGRMVIGGWIRNAPNEPIRLEDAQGNEVRLTPGQTWVLLPQAGSTTPLGPERAAELLANRR